MPSFSIIDRFKLTDDLLKIRKRYRDLSMEWGTHRPSLHTKVSKSLPAASKIALSIKSHRTLILVRAILNSFRLGENLEIHGEDCGLNDWIIVNGRISKIWPKTHRNETPCGVFSQADNFESFSCIHVCNRVRPLRQLTVLTVAKRGTLYTLYPHTWHAKYTIVLVRLFASVTCKMRRLQSEVVKFVVAIAVSIIQL